MDARLHAPVLTVPQVSDEVSDRVFEVAHRLVLDGDLLVVRSHTVLERFEFLDEFLVPHRSCF